MWNIAICDDEPLAQQQLAALWRQHIDAAQYRLFFYTNGIALLLASQTIQFDLIYLDIRMPEPDGIATARQLRANHCSTAIILLTNYDDYLEVGYEIQAFRYRFKPMEETLFLQDLTAWQTQYLPQNQSITVTTANGVHTIDVQDMIYLEITSRKVQIITTKGTISSTEPMRYWQQHLPAGQFLEPYNKILVNTSHVKFFDQSKVITTGNHQLPMSRRKYRSFQAAMLRM